MNLLNNFLRIHKVAQWQLAEAFNVSESTMHRRLRHADKLTPEERSDIMQKALEIEALKKGGNHNVEH